MAAPDRTWEFWIDVGGTFTDCLGQSPDGSLRRFKTLSSGLVLGSITNLSDPRTVGDSSRNGDPDEIWTGWTFQVQTATEPNVEERRVIRFHGETGTFTLDKPLSSSPALGTRYVLRSSLEAPLVAIRYLLACPLHHALPKARVRLGTTRGTNALLTRRGARVAWITTAGFGDLLRIGYQARPRLFELSIRKPDPLYECVLEIHERIGADGRVLIPLDDETVRRHLKQLRDAGIEALAIGFLHGYLYPQHEQRVAELAQGLGFADISLSSDQASLVKLVARGDTTVVNAYLNPVLRHYLQSLVNAWPSPDGVDLRLMTSAGGLVTVDEFQGRDSVLSGPAGGVVGFSGVAQAAGYPRAIGFDMGGTSTDVARFDGRFEYEYETEKAGVRVVAPMLAIHTVAAGGGSICGFDGVKLTVGPESAGADPGPACYGRGGPLSITDINLSLGRLPADALPFPLDHAAVTRRLQERIEEIFRETGKRYSERQLAEGYLRIANSNMAQAVRAISVAKGFDPTEYLLVSFGGAAPQHACAVARELGMRRILDHPQGSLLSALGIGLADVRHHSQQGIYQPWNEMADQLNPVFEALEQSAKERVAQQGIPEERIHCVRSLELRYAGTDWPLRIETANIADYPVAFEQSHRQLYGYARPEVAMEVVAARVEAIGESGWRLPLSKTVSPSDRTPLRPPNTPISANENASSGFPRYARMDLKPGDRVSGPAVIVSATSTTVVEPGWSAEVLSQGELLLTDEDHDARERAPTDCDPVWLEIFHGQLGQIAQQMGTTLRNTASSVNVKERLDYSCALFTATGDLVVNAPHVPVHLGAMSETVRCVLQDHANLRAGDVLVTNDPFRGGSHLPDVTVVTPVFDPEGTTLRWIVASRAHHAEIGGITPGSMPPFSTNLAEEGVLLRSFKLVEAGDAHFDRLQQLLEAAEYPSRQPAMNLADIMAQMAANQQGVNDLHRLEVRHGWQTVARYMQFLQDAAESQMRAALRRIPDGRYSFRDAMDDGAPIQVTIEVEQDTATIDFTGSAPVQTTNLNANRAIVTAAVIYSLRCLIEHPIPLNQGVLAPIRLVIPSGMLDPPGHSDPRRCPAVVAGNVETSQRLVDCLLAAFGVAAASQGTMNNLLFGNETFGYYETICGGEGGSIHGPGADAVHTHMTNTRLTDPEVLEQKYPVRVRRFSIRHASGGRGQFPGGCGIVREIEFLQPLTVSLVTQRRGPFPPFGLEGGEAGQLGVNELKRLDAPPEPLAARGQWHVQPGDILTIQTPGGGGYGPRAPSTK